MKYYLGNFVRQADGGAGFFAPPEGAIGCVDLAPVSAMSSAQSQRPVGIFWTSGSALSSDYAFLGEGDCRELPATAAMASAFKSLVGYKPSGDRLVDLVMDCLADGSDPTGQSGPLPIVPDHTGWIDLWMPGHSKVLAERFEWGKPSSRGRNHTPKLRQLLRAQFQALFDDAQAGKLKDRQQHLRVLDAWCDKYGLQAEGDWREFVPPGLINQVPGRVKHETTISENFNQADSTTVGPQLTWNEVAGSWSTVSNKLSIDSGSGGIRAESDLSSADHSSQITLVSQTAAHSQQAGAAARFNSAAQTFYAVKVVTQLAVVQVVKIVTGTSTVIGGSVGVTVSLPQPLFLSCSGSAIIAKYNNIQTHSLTDTSITGNLRCGAYGFFGSAGDVNYMDDFTASDLAAGGPVFTQLERNVRGVQRGMWTWNRGA